MPPGARRFARPLAPHTLVGMPPASPPSAPVPALAAEANRRIRELLADAQAELRDLTPAERVEYERLRGVYLRAVLAA